MVAYIWWYAIPTYNIIYDMVPPLYIYVMIMVMI